MKDYRTILRNVGWVLIVGGLIDVGFMIYCIANQTSYSSSFNIFAVIPGVFLLRGSLKTAQIVSWFMAFFIAVFTGLLIVMPFLFPFDLLVAYVRHTPATTIGRLVLILILMTLFVWIYRSLTSPVVRNAMDEAQVDHTSFWRHPAGGFWFGGCLPLILVVFISLLVRSSPVDEAKQRAADQIGKGYKFHVKSMNMSISPGGKHVHAVVTAYNDNEIKDLVVEWSE